MSKKLRSETPVAAATTCSWLVLQQRYDSRQTGWTKWEDIDGYRLKDKYGTTVEEWMSACRSWIAMGGRYQYRLIRRTDTVEWEMDYTENNQISGH